MKRKVTYFKDTKKNITEIGGKRKKTAPTPINHKKSKSNEITKNDILWNGFGCKTCKYLAEKEQRGSMDVSFNPPFLFCKKYNQEILNNGSGAYWRIATTKTNGQKFLGEFETHDCKEYAPQHGIRTDCYMSLLKNFRAKIKPKDATFLLITRETYAKDSVGVKNVKSLAPSKRLLYTSKKEKWDFERYTEIFVEEMKSAEARKTMRNIKEMSRLHTFFLVCTERSPVECHRTLVKNLIEQLED